MYSLIYKQQSTEMSECYTQAAAFPLMVDTFFSLWLKCGLFE